MAADTVNRYGSHHRVALALLLAPALVWLVGLIVLPHLELAVISFVRAWRRACMS